MKAPRQKDASNRKAKSSRSVPSRCFRFMSRYLPPARILIKSSINTTNAARALSKTRWRVDMASANGAHTFDAGNEAVMLAIQHAVLTARRRGITVSICGQATSVYPEVTEKLVEWGTTSVSVSPDMINQTREIIANAEVKLGKPPKPD